jgi:imidazole glycerol-phosphate synthase subunit HisH
MSIKKVTVIDYGLGNLLSLKRAFEKINAEVTVTNDHKKIVDSPYVVLPGVGAYKNAMKSINALNLIEPLRVIADKGVPLLGICLGAQLLLSESEEFGTTRGIDIIKGTVEHIKKFNNNKKKIIIPHMGWSKIVSTNQIRNNKNPLFKDLSEEDYFYFVHSFICKPKNKDHILYQTNYENVTITGIHGSKNVYGFQFHPEKSGLSGLKLLKKFLLL